MVTYVLNIVSQILRISEASFNSSNVEFFIAIIAEKHQEIVDLTNSNLYNTKIIITKWSIASPS